MIEDFYLFSDVLPEAAVKIAFALLCGFLLGSEREMKEKPAGLRTITLITVGATLFMIVSDLIARMTEGPPDITRVDTSRIASQVVTGIGFLGAGAIIQSRGSIRGLTTAAAIWVAAGVGLCIGVGFPLLGTGITIVVLLVLVALNPIRAWMGRRGEAMALSLMLPNDALVLRRVRNVLLDNDVRERDVHVRPAEGALEIEFAYRARRGGKQHLLEELSAIKGVRGAEIPT